MIKSKEEYEKIDWLVIAMEDMSWLYAGVESSLEGLEGMKETVAIKKAIYTLKETHDVLWEKMKVWEENNKEYSVT